MKIRDLSIHKYGWTLRIYYAVTCYYTGEILKSLTDIGCPDTVLHRVQGNMVKCEMDTGFTYSNKEHRQSVIVIGMHSSPWEFLNSFEHELRHLVDDIALTLGPADGRGRCSISYRRNKPGTMGRCAPIHLL